MLKQLRGVKRCMVDANNPLLTAKISLCKPFQDTNPYRKVSQKYKQFEEIQFCLESQSNQDICALIERGIRPSVLWKEARLGHIDIRLRHQHAQQSKSISVTNYFDNLRSQWTQLQCFDTDEQHTLLYTFYYDTHSNITIYDICRTIEEKCVQFTPLREDDETWSFLLYDSQNALLNQNTNMHTEWWSKRTFLHNSHDFTNIITILVSPNLLDKDTQFDMDIVGNRKNLLQTKPEDVYNTSPLTHNNLSPTVKSGANHIANTEIIQQQNQDYCESLRIDQLKKHRIMQTRNVSPLQKQKNTHSFTEHNEQNTMENGQQAESTPQLTREELRHARLQFFLDER